jgi:5-methylcytosine-specific restriction protein A
MRNQMHWNSSDRRFRLPDDWESRRAMVKARAHGRCEARIHAKDCDGIGTDCDHIIPGDNHSLVNLQWLSYACHKAKTARESAERNRRYKRLRKHPNERHPGLIGR